MPRPFQIFSQSDYLIQISDINSNTEWQTVWIQISWLLRSQLIWIYTVCKVRVYPGSAGQGIEIGNKHVFSCINIRQVPREVLKTEAGGLPRDLANVNALKKPCLIAIIAQKLKIFAIFRIISCTILFRLFTDVSQTQFPQTIFILGMGSTHFVMAANLWPWYDHTESCIAVH